MKKPLISLLAALALLVPVTAFAGGPDLYKAKCAACHAADGSGNTTMGKKLNIRPLGSVEVQKQTDAQLTQITAKGKGKMPAYETKLSADDIKALVAHIRTLKK